MYSRDFASIPLFLLVFFLTVGVIGEMYYLGHLKQLRNDALTALQEIPVLEDPECLAQYGDVPHCWYYHYQDVHIALGKLP